MNFTAPEYDLLDFHILYSQILDPASIETTFISKMDDSKSFQRVLRCSNLLQRIRFKILDDNLRPLYFPRQTIVRLGLCISPHKQEDLLT